jgi:hypothetical protein
MPGAVQDHRRRMAERGCKRVEVIASPSDAELLRRVARILDKNDEAAARLRDVLSRAAPETRSTTFRDWLAEEAERPDE